MSNTFDNLKDMIPDLNLLNPNSDHDKFFKDEALRFYSVGGTLIESFPDVETSIDQRILSHILLRSIIENFFKIVYIYENLDQSSTRFDEILNDFKNNYAKLWNEERLPMKDKLTPADSDWGSLPKLNLRDMLVQIRNTQGDRLDYIYLIYRISCFDTHGNSLKSLFDAAFNQDVNFPFLQMYPVLNLIADKYIIIYEQIKTA